MLSIILMIITVLSAILALIQKDLLKAAILTGFSGGALAVLFQLLLAPDVALNTSYCWCSYCSCIFSIGC